MTYTLRFNLAFGKTTLARTKHSIINNTRKNSMLDLFVAFLLLFFFFQCSYVDTWFFGSKFSGMMKNNGHKII